MRYFIQLYTKVLPLEQFASEIAPLLVHILCSTDAIYLIVEILESYRNESWERGTHMLRYKGRTFFHKQSLDMNPIWFSKKILRKGHFTQIAKNEKQKQTIKKNITIF